jgi:transcriptional regulator with XRE-family HTH domain
MVSDMIESINVINEIWNDMATVKASEIGIEKVRRLQELQRKSWEDVAVDSCVAKATIYKLLSGDGVTRETVLALARYFGLERREIVTDREWYPQWFERSTGDLWKLLQDHAREDLERFRVIKAKDKAQLVRERASTLGAIEYRSSTPLTNRFLLKEKIVYCVDMPIEAYLLLLEREPNGSIVCLSPSEYVCQNKLGKGLSILPQLDNPHELEAFGATEVGREELIACLLLKEPTVAEFNWLEVSRKQALVLGVEELVSVLGGVVDNFYAYLWKLNYEVISISNE